MLKLRVLIIFMKQKSRVMPNSELNTRQFSKPEDAIGKVLRGTIVHQRTGRAEEIAAILSNTSKVLTRLFQYR